MLNIREAKNEVYGAFAEVTKAMGSPRRLELLDLLVQGPRSVNALSEDTGQALATTSQHLQVLKRGDLVQARRQGTTIHYALAPGVDAVLVAMRRMASHNSPGLRAAHERLRGLAGPAERIDREGLIERVEAGSLLLDVRPEAEFREGHLPGAVNLPRERLEEGVARLGAEAGVVVMCRGPYCVYAAEAASALRRRGVQAWIYEGSVADWRYDGGALE